MRISLVVLAMVCASVELRAQDASYEFQDREVVQQTVDDVMARPEFERLLNENGEESENPAWFDRFLDWIGAWLAGGDAREGRDVATGSTFIVYAVVFLIVVAALGFILRAVLDSAPERALADELEHARLVRAGAAPGETPPEEFWSRAHELAATGNEKQAIRELLLGAMSTLERLGLIRHRRGLTNRDYFWAASHGMRTSLATIIAAFERVYFGRRAANRDLFQECADAYREAFETTSPTSLGPVGPVENDPA